MPTSTLDFESLVNQFYEPLYRFAMSLSGHPDQAADLTQQTFYRALSREGQLRDRSKAKSWLFTILYREFLGSRRHRLRHPTQSLEDSNPGQWIAESRVDEFVDSQTLVEKLGELDDHHRVPLILFYQEDYSYREIAEFLKVPVGTVMSRLNRGKHLLRERLHWNSTSTPASRRSSRGPSASPQGQGAGPSQRPENKAISVCA